MHASSASRPSAGEAFTYGQRPNPSRSRVSLALGLAFTVVVAVGGYLLVSANQEASAAKQASSAAVAERDSLRSSLAAVETQVSSLQGENSSLEERLQDLQVENAALSQSAWKVRAYAKMNLCIGAIIAAYNAVDFVQELGPAMDNTLASPACTPVMKSSPRSF